MINLNAIFRGHRTDKGKWRVVVAGLSFFIKMQVGHKAIAKIFVDLLKRAKWIFNGFQKEMSLLIETI